MGGLFENHDELLDLGLPNLDTTPFALSPCACLICKACDLLSRTSS